MPECPEGGERGHPEGTERVIGGRHRPSGAGKLSTWVGAARRRARHGTTHAAKGLQRRARYDPRRMRVGVVVVNHERGELLRECLGSLAAEGYPDAMVVVVDNGSHDDSVALARATLPAAEVLALAHNTGFAHANNVGIWHALRRGCEAVLVLNNDTRVAPGALAALAAAVDPAAGVAMAAPKVLLVADGTIDATGQRITRDGFAKCADAGRPAAECTATAERFSPYGAAAFYHRRLLEDIAADGEWFDEDFRFYCEELDLGWRARLRGWSCTFVPAAVVHHHRGGTAGQYSELLAYYTSRNTLFNVLKNYPGWYAGRALLLSLVRPLVLAIGLAARRGPAHHLGKRTPPRRLASILLRAWVDAVRGAPRMLEKRRRIQARRVVPPEEVARWFRELGEPFLAGLLR